MFEGVAGAATSVALHSGGFPPAVSPCSPSEITPSPHVDHEAIVYTGTPAKTAKVLHAAQTLGIGETAILPTRGEEEFVATADIRRLAASVFGKNSDNRITILTHGLENPAALVSEVRSRFPAGVWGLWDPYDLNTPPFYRFARGLKEAGLVRGPGNFPSERGFGFAKSKSETRYLFNRIAADHPELRHVWATDMPTEALTLGALQKAAVRMGKPLPREVVVLPEMSAGSLGAKYIDLTAPDAEAAVGRVREHILRHKDHFVAREGGNFGHVAVAEYVDGDEYTFECVTVGGEFYPIAATVKPGMDTDFLERAKLVISPRSKVFEKLSGAAGLVFNSVKETVGDGIHHVEFRIDPQGKVFFIEWNLGRPAGGSIPQAVKAATGQDLYALGLSTAMGDRPPFHEFAFAYSAAITLFPDEPGTYAGMGIRLNDKFLLFEDSEEAQTAVNKMLAHSSLRVVMSGLEYWIPSGTELPDITDFVGAGILVFREDMPSDVRGSESGKQEMLNAVGIITSILRPVVK